MPISNLSESDYISVPPEMPLMAKLVRYYFLFREGVESLPHIQGHGVEPHLNHEAQYGGHRPWQGEGSEIQARLGQMQQGHPLGHIYIHIYI